jgi:two-component SAPR family response regulator
MFSEPEELLEYVEKYSADIAVLDICMYSDLNGVTLAKRLKELNVKINIIFATAHERFLKDAMSLHASGYIMKPVTEEDVRRELDDLRHPLLEEKNALLKVRCFGNFDVFTLDNEPLHFERSKAKEVFAYLIYKHGATCTIREIAAILFEDEPYDRKQQGYTQKIISSLMNTLRQYDASDLIVKKYNSIAIRPELVDCDCYRFERIDVAAIDSYENEYMAQYSWAEFIPHIDFANL